MTELLSTARLQLHGSFDLWQAQRQVSYYRRLGITHLYLSPITEARAGSTHGYDVTDPTVVRAELGGEAALRALADALHEQDMGAILDIVPNHMAADTANPWWRDVLKHGPGSRYAAFFDVDWDAPTSPGRVWLPWLKAPVCDVLARNELRIEHAPEPELCHVDWRLPLADGSCEGIDEGNPESMRVLLDRQHYRLAWWRSSGDVVNYRRFFDIDGLVALNMDVEEAFDATHALPLRLLATGVIDGLRIDHIDGLAHPQRYLERLQHELRPIAARRGKPVSVHVEKILRGEETLPLTWPVDGSTGYEIMDRLGALLHDPRGESTLALAWRKASGRHISFAGEERLARHQWLRRGLQSDFARTMRAWDCCLDASPEAGDLTRASLARAAADVLAHMPVYRTYLGDDSANDADRRVLADAFDHAERQGHPDDRDALQWLQRAMLDEPPRDTAWHASWRTARLRFEQLSAPLAAKSVEDSAFYRYGVWLSRNEVGSDPARFACSPDAFHRHMQQRAANSARSLSTTATHDHKRGEDVRARMAAWSERPERWLALLQQAMPLLCPPGETVARGDVALLLQTLVAAWPLTLEAGDTAGVLRYFERVLAWWIKALREARLHTRWTRPDDRYESAATALLQRLASDASLAPLLANLAKTAHWLDAPGALNGLVAVTLRNTLPGVPDLYQGCDYWDLSLVDPDNRTPVDYGLRYGTLSQALPPGELMPRFRDGAIKQALLARLLSARRALPGLFSQGDYQPWVAEGPAADHVLAFTRRHGTSTLLVAVPRLCMRWMDGATLPQVPAEAWRDTRLQPPEGVHFRDLLGERALSTHDHAGLPLSLLFWEWPVAVWHATTEEP
ncbi:malto-oligosyltrehalose synthase [Dyella jiangningensis]|uniref:malto-oligosyltrehalose synthase n=1 Tax=Dyella jiangningensis TaxID=1379159 RepID=UPI0024107665|nr:malto-oligosyltrehalose synthase [Dyella jiangningensis]MDG2538869.1 malto-oligosyltrehalose synthase [Dyella jiangningensis]